MPVPGAGERVLRLIGGVAVTDYLDIIAAPAQMEAAWRAIWTTGRTTRTSGT